MFIREISNLEYSGMFYSFKNKDERRQFGGSAFIEIQYCKLKSKTKIKK